MKRTNWWVMITAALVLSSLLAGAGPGGVAALPVGAPGGQGGPAPRADGFPANPQGTLSLPREAGPEQVRQRPRLYPVDAATFGLMKAAANAAAQGAAHLPAGKPGGGAPPPSFDTLQMCDGGNGCWNPPDGALAVGPSSVLAGVNEAFALYPRSGGNLLLGPVSFNAFFGIGDSIFDPRALYDKGSGRFVLLATTMNSSAETSRFTLAVSKNDNPADASEWCKYNLDAATGTGNSLAWADFPGLGMDRDTLYVTSNQFRFANNSFDQARLMALDKALVYPNPSGVCPAGTPTGTNLFDLRNPPPDNNLAFSVMPATKPDGEGGSMYFVNAFWASGSTLVLRSLDPSTMTLSEPSSVTVSPYNLPADAQQPGGGFIDTGDTRLSGAVYRYGKIYTANTTHTVAAGLSSNPNSRANVQWYAITPETSTAVSSAVTNQDVAYYFPGVMPGCSGSLCPDSGVFTGLEFSGSGRGQPASAYSSLNGLNTTRYATGVRGYVYGSRWGDYPGMSPDPVPLPSGGSPVWVLGEYAKASSRWGTAVATITGP